MKKLRTISTALVAATTISYASAAGMSGVLDGMFANVTAPDVTSSQFRGSISGGGMYIRSPISNLQVFALDPPRLSTGCGGIDLYLGAFSYITAEKLTQFIRSVAQNAAPLAFKMAIDATFPQLGGVLDKFQAIAQKMNDSQTNSCTLAHGIMDGAKNPSEVFTKLEATVTAGFDSITGIVGDFTEALTSNQTQGSKNVEDARKATNADGSPVVSDLGNRTWNALNARKNSGYIFSITDDPVMAQQVVMSLIGTSVGKGGNDASAPPLYEPYPAPLRLKSLFEPSIGSGGAKEVPILSCNGDTACLVPTQGVFATTGIDGFVRRKMFGSDTATSAEAGSIVYNMATCSSDKCGLTASQLQFLNSIGKIPVVGLLTHAQSSPQIITQIAPELIGAMVNEISVVYGQSVLDAAISSYSKTSITKPTGYDDAIKNMLIDLRDVEARSKKTLATLNEVTVFIDSAIRANGSVMRYRPR